MQVITTVGTNKIYEQRLDGSETLNATISHLMQMPQGEHSLTQVINNGHELLFRTGPLHMGKFLSVVNGPIPRKQTNS